ncbi:MAG: hypothetical protein JST83_04965 [Bacteroidetes bacterium]|nr:hypothetical protein [Bacteroidota bacterium]
MEIEIKAKAMKNLTEIAEYLDTINTAGSGSRWLDKFLERVETYARPSVSYPLCHHQRLAKRGMSCITFRRWVVAFKIIRGKFVIYEIIFGPILR